MSDAAIYTTLALYAGVMVIALIGLMVTGCSLGYGAGYLRGRRSQKTNSPHAMGRHAREETGDE